MMTLLNVDLPDPFGPIRACVSPWRTTRSMPRRISLPSTVAWRSLTSNVAAVSLPFSLISLHLDQDIVAVGRDGEHLDRLGRRQGAWFAGVQVEGRTMLRAFDRLEVDVDLAFVQVVLRVAADRVDRAESLVAEVHHRDQALADGEPSRFTVSHLGGRAHADGRHQRTPRSSSASIAASAPSRTSVICTRSSTSWKNPLTMRRSASSCGIPRDCR